MWSIVKNVWALLRRWLLRSNQLLARLWPEHLLVNHYRQDRLLPMWQHRMQHLCKNHPLALPNSPMRNLSLQPTLCAAMDVGGAPPDGERE